MKVSEVKFNCDSAFTEMNFLHRYKESLNEVNTLDSLDEVCHQFHIRLRGLNLREIDSILLDNLTLHLCLKVVMMCLEHGLPPQARELADYLLDQGLVTEFPARVLRALLNKTLDRSYQLPAAQEPLHVTASVAGCLDALLRGNQKADRYVNKNYGQAIIDLNGDFIWADQNSEKFFEMRLREMKNTNFFDLMIPFSRKYIYKKFGGAEIFGKEKPIFSSATFSYVIYSKTSMNKFAKRLQEKNHTDPDAVDHNVAPEEREMGNYYKYLKALSSKATLVPIKFTRAELRDIISNQKYNVCVTDGLRAVVEDFGETALRGERAEDGADVVCKLAVILETRAAKNTPAFPYSKMNGDPRIVEFREKIKRKLM